MAKCEEKLIPAINSFTKYEEKKHKPLELNGTISVNKLLNKTKLPDSLEITLSTICPEPKEKISKRQFSSVKQEQHFRLNRENKLKVNEEITTYLENAEKKHIIPKKITKKNEEEQIKDAAKQISEINHILENKPKIKPKKKKIDHLFGENITIRPRQQISDTIRHSCTKAFGKDVKDYDAIIERFERQLQEQERIMKRQDKKLFFSTPNVQKQSSTVKKPTDLISKQTIPNNSATVNVKNNKSREEMLKEQALRFSKYNRKDKSVELFKRPQFKYKSLKDMNFDQNKLKQFEEEVRQKYKMEDFRKETKVLYENKIFKKTNDDEYYSELNLIKDLQLDKPKEYHNMATSPKQPLSPKQPVKQISPKLSPKLPPKQSPKKSTSPKGVAPKYVKVIDSPRNELEILKQIISNPKRSSNFTKIKNSIPENIESKSIGVDTNSEAENELQRRVMKSDYLKREFRFNPEFRISQNNERTSKSPDVGCVNWADKYKFPPVRKLPRELEYLMS